MVEPEVAVVGAFVSDRHESDKCDSQPTHFPRRSDGFDRDVLAVTPEGAAIGRAREQGVYLVSPPSDTAAVVAQRANPVGESIHTFRGALDARGGSATRQILRMQRYR